jgi:signal peptidase
VTQTALDTAVDDPPKPKGMLQYLGIGIGAGALALVVLIAVMVVVIPAVTGSRALTVLTGSMAPAYPAGTLVIVRPTPPGEVRIGDVMTYQLKSGEPVLVTHRVIEKIYDTNGELSFTTKGDNNDLADDEPVKAVQVVGTVWYAIPLLGWVNNAVNGELRPLIIPIVVGLLFAYAVWMIISGARDRVKKKRAASA